MPKKTHLNIRAVIALLVIAQIGINLRDSLVHFYMLSEKLTEKTYLFYAIGIHWNCLVEEAIPCVPSTYLFQKCFHIFGFMYIALPLYNVSSCISLFINLSL